MDLSAPARDIEELIVAFVAMQGTELAQMKELWRARNFSFIHEARPKDVNSSFYAQGLFSSALIHVLGDEPLHWKVGAIYVLYTLHGTQLQEAGGACRIYLSLEELEALQSLVKEMTKQSLNTALFVVRKMFSENMFLYGSVSANQKRIATTVARLVKQANTRVLQARYRLLTNVPMEQHLHGHLAQELGMHEIAHLTEDYAAAKRRALCESFKEEKEVGGERGSVDDDGKEAWALEPTFGADLVNESDLWDAHKLQLLSPSQPPQGSDPVPRSVSAEGGTGGSMVARRRNKNARQKTITEYERELRERIRMSEFEKELVAQLDQALDNDD